MTNLDFLLKTIELKDERRTGWELRNIEDPETVAGHSWGTAFLYMIYGSQEKVDISKCVKMAVVHDIAEAETGDIAHRAVDVDQNVSKEQKRELELETLTKITKELDKQEILHLWQEYEERETINAKFVKDMDLIDLCIQALKYEKDRRYDPEEENENFQHYDHLDEFFATTKPRLNTETGKQIFQEVKKRYEEAKKE